MSRFGTFNINGEAYDLDDLTLDEVEAIENLCGGSAFSELNFGSAKAMKAISYTLLRRNHPEITMDEVGNVKMVDMMPPDEEQPPLPAPGEAENTNESGLAESGVQLSVASTTG